MNREQNTMPENHWQSDIKTDRDKANGERDETRTMYELGWWAFGILLVYVLVVKVFHFNPSRYLMPCLMWNLFGWYCPGCGGTRAVKALLSGDILKSFYYHPVAPYAAALYAWFMVSNTVEILSKGKLPIGMKYRNCYLYIAAALMGGHFVVRNVLLHVFGIAM